jgi:hypothetical protein
VEVTTENGMTLRPGAYTYVPPPAIHLVDPRLGALAGGTAVRLRGRGFTAYDAGPCLVTVAGVAAGEVVVVSDTEIRIRAPEAVAYGPRDARTITPLINLAHSRQRAGEVAAALTDYRAAIELAEASGGPRDARLFEAWDEYRQDGDRVRLRERIAPLEHELRALLERAARTSAKTKRHRLFAKNLLKRWPALWTFTLVDGVEPTNNHAERGLRGAVIYRKLSLGSQSDHGERTIERLLSASVTCRLQGRSLFAYLTDVLSARLRGDPIAVLA